MGTGYLAFVRGRSLFIQPFDEVSVRLSGVPIPVADLVVSTQSGYAAFSLSRNGVLAYSKGERQYQQLVWKDRSGAELGRLGQPALQGNVRLVEDGGKVLVTRTDPETFAPTTWLYDAVRNGASKIADGTSAVASRDAVWLAFRQNPSSSGEASIARLRLRGGDTPEKLASIAGWATDFSPDGRYLLTMSPEPNNQLDVLLVEIRTGKVTPFIASPAGEGAAKFSPDQKWVAYVSDHTGRGEVFVRSMSDDGERRIPVSTEGASQPQWSDDGRELFYVARTGVLTAVDASTVGGHFVAGRPHPMFPIHSRIASMVANSFFGPDYAVSRDGRRFLVVETVSSDTGLTVLINWPQMVQQDEAHDR